MNEILIFTLKKDCGPLTILHCSSRSNIWPGYKCLEMLLNRPMSKCSPSSSRQLADCLDPIEKNNLKW